MGQLEPAKEKSAVQVYSLLANLPLKNNIKIDHACFSNHQKKKHLYLAKKKKNIFVLWLDSLCDCYCFHIQNLISTQYFFVFFLKYKGFSVWRIQFDQLGQTVIFQFNLRQIKFINLRQTKPIHIHVIYFRANNYNSLASSFHVGELSSFSE